MARARSPEKRRAILQAAVDEIAKAGLAAPTAKIARRAGVAAGTLFLYFSNKEELLNELYLEIKGEAYKRINANFPHEGTLECRARHVELPRLGTPISGQTQGFEAVERLRTGAKPLHL